VLLISILNISKDLIIPFMISLPVNFCIATMAPKKNKGKNVSTNDSKALVLKTESNVAVLVSPILSLDLANRFSHFSSDYPILYSSTLISPYDPFVDASKKSRATGTDFKKPSIYMILPFSQCLFSIEMNRSSAKSTGELANSYFPLVSTGFLSMPSRILLIIPTFCFKPNP
jgi:hypothetical protein